ncbi:NUDIX domain-containing protein, partial [Streptomyces olivochromogenes]|uniref:NUDIX domain-containing protein n=1 Tax=Streptomyces olivochromogenes TaxID=1963 RepID=UPI0036DCB6F1
VVTDEQDRVLTGWRIKEADHPCWCLPGGHIEPGESPQEAALRELHEETGLQGIWADPFVLLVDTWQAATRATVGVEVRLNRGPVSPQVCEPLTISRWEWRLPAEEPLFTASRDVLDAWYRRPVSDGVSRHYLERSDPRPNEASE